jgi:hypothetical protein
VQRDSRGQLYRIRTAQDPHDFVFDKPSAIAKSEFFASSEDVDFLNQNVRLARRWVLEFGQKGTLHPDYPQWRKDNENTLVGQDRPGI